MRILKDSATELVVVSYRTPADLTRFCDSLLAAPPTVPWHCTVVNVDALESDIAAASAIIDRFKERDLRMAISVWNTDWNMGYARACNWAAKQADPWDWDHIAFFNADVTLMPGAVDTLVGALEDHSDWAVVGPRQVDSRGRLTHGGVFGTWEKPRHRGWHHFDKGQVSDILQAVTVSGAAYFVRRDAWEDLSCCPIFLAEHPDAGGAFLPTSHYYEETWFSYHAAAHGWKVMYYGPVLVQHEWHQASPVGGWAERQMPISREMFRRMCDKHGIAHD